MVAIHSAGDFRCFSSVSASLETGDVHVWRIDVEVESPRIPLLWSILPEEEHDRANRFYFSRDRDRFVVCHGVLRSLIAEYLNLNPAAVTFQCNLHGKPYLGGECADALFFNISHSHHLALFAFSRNREIGVDVERIDARVTCDQITERYFSPMEANALRALPPGQQAEAFFLGWTRKEAFVKARGEGLSIPLDRFAVSVEPGQPAALLWVKGNPADTEKVVDKKSEPGLRLCCSSRCGGWRIRTPVLEYY